MDPLQQAHALAQAGDLEGSARLCRAILARTPAHDYALFLLGSIEAQQGRLDEAAKHLSQAIKTNPRSPDALASYGKILLEQKRVPDAIDMLTRALALRPQFPLALILRGQGFAEAGKQEDALKDFDAALRLDPHSIIALNNRAHLLITMNRHDEARASVDAVLKLAPSFVPGIIDRIAILIHDKKFEMALSEIGRVLPLDPNNPDLWNSHGQVLSQLKRYGDALVSLGKAIALNPESAPAYLNCANVLMEQERLEDALARCDQAIAADPRYASALVLRGNILLHLGRRQESLASYDAAVAAAPDYADAHYHRGSALLLDGKFKEGFADFEYRWKALDCGFDRPSLNAREWRGEPLTGKTIVVYSEQGLGDTIQFARFLPVIIGMGARLTFLCHPNLPGLFAPYAQTMEIIAFSDARRPFDFQCALMSLPYRLGVDPAAMTGGGPYVFADEERVAQWRQRIGSDSVKLGIVWQGNPRGAVDKGRSIPLAHFAPLGNVPGVRLISIQKTHGLDQLSRLPPGMIVETLGDFDMGDDAFIDTAAIMRGLDLIVTSDTAIAHLAGALGVPCWVALKQVPDWRWMLDRADSPWYPSLRLFHQTRAGDWNSVFDRIAEELRDLIDRKEVDERP